MSSPRHSQYRGQRSRHQQSPPSSPSSPREQKHPRIHDRASTSPPIVDASLAADSSASQPCLPCPPNTQLASARTRSHNHDQPAAVHDCRLLSANRVSQSVPHAPYHRTGHYPPSPSYPAPAPITTRNGYTHRTLPRDTRLPERRPRSADETLLAQLTPRVDDSDDDMASSTSRSRDSHDLSMSPRDVTRDSLVANMLLSLDQFSLGQGDTHYADDADYDDAPQVYDTSRRRADRQGGTDRAFGPSQQQQQQHRHQYSYSSDIDIADDQSRMSSQTSRGRRSNSSSNFNAPSSRLSTMKDQANRGQPAASYGAHSRGGRGSNSSSASIDAGYMHSPGRSQRGGFHRSASFDHHPNGQRPQQIIQSQSGPMSPFRVDFSQAAQDDDDDDFNAAPTPTVPGGPRRVPSSPAMPPPPPEPVASPKVERRRSLSRSLKSVSGRKPSTAKHPPPPPLNLESAPSPSVGYEKAKELIAGDPLATIPAPAKEKTGFFRRVFGGGSKNQQPANPATESPKHSSQYSVSADGFDRPPSNKATQQAPTSSPGPAPPSRDTTSSHSRRPVQKKTSSFFRRRKKSTADENPHLFGSKNAPPVPAISPAAYQMDIEKSEPSPVSSLRKVMNPYLANTAASTPSQGATPLTDITNAKPPRTDADERAEYKREFSPDYEPSPNARIKTVRSDSDREASRVTESPSRRPPAPPGKPIEREGSFLDLDAGSDNEDSPLPIQANKFPDKGLDAAKPPSSPLSPSDTIRPTRTSVIRHPVSADSPDGVKLALPIEGARTPGSPRVGTPQKSPNATPKLRVEISGSNSPKPVEKKAKDKGLDEPEFVVGAPTEDDRQKAQRIFAGNEDFIQKDKAASWMGEEGPIRQRTLQAYMDLYDFEGLSIVDSLRMICSRLVLRAETQQVDRILVAFAKRWCDRNPNHGFKTTDVIHTICYSIMLLNTDLHLADIEHKMTRAQFVKNTLATIVQTMEEAAPDAFPADKNNMLGINQGRTSGEHERRSFRNSFKPPPRGDSQTNPASPHVDGCGPLVKSPFIGGMKAWEEQIDMVLRGIFSSIRDERLPLFGAEPERSLSAMPSQSSLSVIGMLKRSPSVLSKSPSEGQSSRGRITDGSARMPASRWSSKSRSRPGLGRTGFNSSRTSFDDDGSLFSPAMSSATWSKYSLGRTQTSVSQDSFGSAMLRGDYQQSIGFANALSQAIIRDEDANGDGAPSILSVDMQSAQLLEDESLELSGPPWVKEGMVIHKHHLDGVDKKAKERSWNEVFAVIQKGQLNLFSFSMNKSMRAKNRRNAKSTAPVGGGNWQDNATSMGSFNLRQTLASALPPPGYSRTRPHVWALSLPNGAVHLFQVGTPEIIREFVNTANYWSSRLSTHPLIGGVSNIEYGWSESIVNNSLVTAIMSDEASVKNSRPGSAATGRRSSVQSGRSFRSTSMDQGPGGYTHGRGKLPGDRVHVAVWMPPQQSLRPSTASEREQLGILQTYVKSIEEDLQAHNQMRSPMLLAFTPRGSNAGKAMTNWERKSSYLLREIVKYRTYVDALIAAETRQREIYTERDLARRAARGELSDADMEVSGSSESEDEGDVTIRPE